MLADVLVASNIHQVYHGLRAHEQVLVEDLNLFTVPLAFTYRSIFAEHGLAANENVAFLLVLLLIFARNYAFQFLKKSVKVLNILLEEFISDDLHVSDWVHITLIMHDFLAGEGPHHVEDAIDSLNVR